jgi:hypothetical protein
MEKNCAGSAIHKCAICVDCLSGTSKIALIIGLVLYISLVGATSSVFAVSYFPAPFYHRWEKIETPMRAGETAYLFHSGTADVKRTIHVSDILTVYRITPSCEVKTVGKIKVISYVGETYLKGVVVEGEIMPNDIAKKGDVSSLIILTGVCAP